MRINSTHDDGSWLPCAPEIFRALDATPRVRAPIRGMDIVRFTTLPFVALTLAATVSQAQAAQVCRYQNFMPEYFAFETKTAAMAPDKRADLFMSDFMPRHPIFYGAGIYEEIAKTGKLHEYVQGLFDLAKPETIPGFPPLDQVRFHAVAKTIETDFTASQEKLLKTFPDFACQTEIEFGPSVLAFDGHGYEDDQKQMHLLFGVDTISLLHGPDDMAAFFTHELFHVYHRQVMAGRQPSENVVWWSLWEEGLATYMSKALNEPVAEQRVLGFPVDMAQQMEKPGMRKLAAQQMLAAFDNSEDYATWFEGLKAKSTLPPRSGYYMGFKMMEGLAHDHSLQDLAHMSPTDVKPLVKAFLEKEVAAK